MALNIALKIAIIKAGKSQVELATLVGIQQSRLSNIVNGHSPATKEERDAIAGALGCPVDDLFPGVAA